NATPKTITTWQGIYRQPSYSPDGETSVYRREDGNNQQGFAYTTRPGMSTTPACGGAGPRVLKRGTNPQCSADGKRIYYLGGPYPDNSYESVARYGNDKRVHFTSKYGNNFVPSPNDKRVAFSHLFKVHVAPMPKAGTGIDLRADPKAIPVTQVAED